MFQFMVIKVNRLEITILILTLNLITFSTIPPIIESEAEASHKILNEKGVCVQCVKLLMRKLAAQGQVLQTEGFIAFCPWSPSYPYEFWISPKKHTTSFSKITQKEINDLSLNLKGNFGWIIKNCQKCFI